MTPPCRKLPEAAGPRRADLSAPVPTAKLRGKRGAPPIGRAGGSNAVAPDEVTVPQTTIAGATPEAPEGSAKSGQALAEAGKGDEPAPTPTEEVLSDECMQEEDGEAQGKSKSKADAGGLRTPLSWQGDLVTPCKRSRT